MSQVKRMSGSGKKPYVWKETAPSSRKPAQSVRRVPVYSGTDKHRSSYSGNARSISATKPVLALLAVGMFVAMLITVISVINLSAENSKLESLMRKQEELSETLESAARTLEMEKRPQVVCQLAEEKLYMVRPNRSVALNVTSGDTQTAGR